MKYFPFVIGLALFLLVCGCQKSIEQKHKYNLKKEAYKLSRLS